MLEAHGTARAPGFPGGSHREKLLARRGTAAAHAARRLAGFAAAGSGAGRETDRPFRERSGVDRRRAHGAGFARRFENLRQEMENSLAELRDNSAGTLTVGANESTSLYLSRHIETFRRLHPKINVRVRRSLSSKIPNELLDGNLELGVISYDPPDERLTSTVIYTDALAFVVSPKHRLAGRKAVSISDLAAETFIAHNVISPYRDVVLRAFQERRVPLNMPVEMPTIETIRKLVQNNQGVAFLPRMCVEQEIEQGLLREVKVKELHVERKIRLIYPTRRVLSHAARAFLEVVRGK